MNIKGRGTKQRTLNAQHVGERLHLRLEFPTAIGRVSPTCKDSRSPFESVTTHVKVASTSTFAANGQAICVSFWLPSAIMVAALFVTFRPLPVHLFDGPNGRGRDSVWEKVSVLMILRLRTKVFLLLRWEKGK